MKFSVLRMCHLIPRSVLSTGPRTCEISLKIEDDICKIKTRRTETFMDTYTVL